MFQLREAVKNGDFSYLTAPELVEKLMPTDKNKRNSLGTTASFVRYVQRQRGKIFPKGPTRKERDFIVSIHII